MGECIGREPPALMVGLGVRVIGNLRPRRRTDAKGRSSCSAVSIVVAKTEFLDVESERNEVNVRGEVEGKPVGDSNDGQRPNEVTLDVQPEPSTEVGSTIGTLLVSLAVFES